MEEHTPATWQEWLAQVVTNPRERTRLASAAQVHPLTLKRWIEGTSRPHVKNIRFLLQSLPKEIQPQLMSLLAADYPELLAQPLPEDPLFQGIPSTFYAQVMRSFTHTPRAIFRQSIQDLLLPQALQLLDSKKQGISVLLAVCMPPRSGRSVRSLREVGGLATPPWPRDLSGRVGFLGAESLAGHAVTHAHASVINSRDEHSLFAAQWTEYEESAVAFPILLSARMVGCLIVSSAHPNFFTEPCLALIADYADLVTFMFNPEQSYDQSEIALEVMPPYTSQYPLFADYNQRVSRILLERKALGQPVTLQQARLLVWQDLEDLLLQGDYPGEEQDTRQRS